jgi:uncharacterized membrane protein YfcA
VSMLQHFREGGWGMFPTLGFGLLMLAVAVRYALRPERRFVPLLLGLGTVTLASGLLGFVTGLMATFQYIGGVPADQRYLALIGLGESLNNVAFALVFVVLAALAASLGAWRLTREPLASAT